ncbi:MAG: ABC transporter ATP-binding protein, partial [Gemmatimonadaceae bacterium]|nr:ABC transporter ATP-binding protein [Acetobacteraceae bacterium]
MTAFVSVRNLRLDARTPRGLAHILRGVDLDIGRGRIMGVVGESGSGKSSLALCMLRMLPGNVTPLRGQLLIDGTDLVALDPAAMQERRGRTIAMIFQDPASALNPLFTIATHLVDVLRRRHPGMARREALAQAQGALVRVGIADPADRLR